MDSKERAKLFQRFLEEEGYRPTIDNDGDIVFKHEGGTFIILVRGEDDEYFILLYPNFWEIESDEELERAYLACNTANREQKVAKVWVREDRKNVNATLEDLLPTNRECKERAAPLHTRATGRNEAFCERNAELIVRRTDAAPFHLQTQMDARKQPGASIAEAPDRRVAPTRTGRASDASTGPPRREGGAGVYIPINLSLLKSWRTGISEADFHP